MSVLYSTISHQIPNLNHHTPNGKQSNLASCVQLCLTCAKIRALQDCTSVFLECQGLSSNTETKSNILQVICQLLRVQWESLEFLILDDGNLPFCPSCLKTITEIIILREKLFQIETEIREKLRKLESSVAECLKIYGDKMKKMTPELGSIKYDDLRFIFQKQVMEEHSNKELLQQKILEMNQNPTAFATESIPSMIQIHFEKNVFSIVDRKPTIKVEPTDFPVVLIDTATDTKDLEISEQIATSNRADLNASIDDEVYHNDDMPPVLEAEGTCVYDEDFTFITVRHDMNITDDSDYGSPSKKSKTEIISSAIPALEKSQKEKKGDQVSAKKTSEICVEINPKSKKSSKSKLENFYLPKEGSKSTDPLKLPRKVKENQKHSKLVIASTKKVYSAKTKKSTKTQFRKSNSNSRILEIETENPIPSSSKQKKTTHSEKEVEDDEDDASDWVPDNGESDSLYSESSESDHEERQPMVSSDEGGNDATAEDQCEATVVSIPKFAKKHTNKRKHSHHSPKTVNNRRIEPTYVKLIQEKATFTAKDKTVWTTTEPDQNRRTRPYEILNEKGGLTGPAQDDTLTPTQIFKLMFPATIVETIVKHTNAYAEHMNTKDPKKNSYKWSPTTVDEIYGYIGILLCFGVEKKRNSFYGDAWTPKGRQSTPMIPATMSRERFATISCYLRFDDKVGRMISSNQNENGDEEESKFYYISEIFEPFVENMQIHLSPYDTLIVDEMLVKFRGSAKFRVYMKSKPGKYGIKFWAVCDVETGYILKIALYEGKVGGVVEREHGKKVVLNLVKKYFGSGRGVTMDNFFTSKALGEELIRRNMSMLGTLNHNRMDVIPKFVDPKGRELLSSVFAFQGDFTMVSYVPKKGRAVLLLSTQHHSAEINTADHQRKPKMILDYNMTKGGVDTADGMIAVYSCQRTVGRWPMKIFHALIDIAALNAYTIFKIHKTSANVSATVLRRKLFLWSVAEGLMEPQIAARLQGTPSKTTILTNILENLGYEKVEKVGANKAKTAAVESGAKELPPKFKRNHCFYCPKGKRKVSRSRCISCLKMLCATCGTRIFHCPSPKCTYVLASTTTSTTTPLKTPQKVRKNLQSTFVLTLE